jgi:hypothetical protein
MGILQLPTQLPGQVGVLPNFKPMVTTDSLATITTAGYLNAIDLQSNPLQSTDVIPAFYAYDPVTKSKSFGYFLVTITNGTITLDLWENPGNVLLPVVDGDFATFNGTSGQIEDAGYSPSDATKAKVVMAGSAVVANRIAHFVDTGGTIDDTAAAVTNLGDIYAGADAVAGAVRSYPATTATGYLSLTGVSNSGAFNTIISNAAMGQTSTISIPNPGASTANFLLDTGTANILAKQQFVGIQSVLLFGTGTWTTTRVAQGNYVKRHTPGDETSIIGVDITPIIRAVASKGFRLDSFDVIYAIAANALDAHTVTLDRIAYANNVAVSVTSVAITGTLATATQANPYVTNISINTPAFDITADSKYIIEITVNNAAASEYDYYGIDLRFSETIG